MRISVLVCLSLVIGLLTGCLQQAPPCPTEKNGTPPANAGCMIVRHGRLLVVLDQTGKLSIPGGGTEPGETPRCTAHRETWEETGLDVRPTDLQAVFDNGFHLFRCKLHENSGQIDPPARFEIQRAFWLAPDQFKDHQWRYPPQARAMAQWISNDPSR